MASAASIQAVRNLKESKSEGVFSSGQPPAAASSVSPKQPNALLDERSIADKLYTRSERSLLDGDWDISSPKRPSLVGGEVTVLDDELAEIVEEVDLGQPATKKQEAVSGDASTLANGAGLLTMLRDSLPYWGSEGMESLHQAVRKALASLKLGEVNSVDVETSETALLLCAQYGASDLVEFLVEKNADVNHRLLSGATALHYMTNKSTFSASAVRKLLEYGADPNIAEEHNGATPLHYAADSGHLETCQRLVQHGADASIKDYGGYDAAGYAQGAGHAECEHFLRDCTGMSLYQIEIPAAAKAEPDYVAAARAKRKSSSKTAVDSELSKLNEARMALAQLESDRSRLETERQMTKLKFEAEEATSRMERAEARALAATHDTASLRAKLDMAQAAADKVASELRTAQLEASSALVSSASTVAAATARADELERSRSRATATAESAAERAIAAELALALAKNEAEVAKRERSEAMQKAERDTAKARSAESALEATVAAFEARRDADLAAAESCRAEAKVAAEAAAERAAQIALTAALGNGSTKVEEAEARARSATERAAKAEAEREFARAEAATVRSAGAVALEEVRAAHEAVRTQAERRADQADVACASARDEAARLRQRLQEREATADADRRRMAERIDALQAQASQLSASVAAKMSEAAAADSRAERAERHVASLVEQLSALASTSSADQKLQALEQASKNQIAELERARDEAIAEAQRVRQTESASLVQQAVEAAVLSALESHDQTASQRIAAVIDDSVISAFENATARDASSQESRTEKLARRAADMALAGAAKHEASSLRDELSKARDTMASLTSRTEVAEAARSQLDHDLQSLRSEVAAAVAGERAARAELAAAKEAALSATSSSVAEAASQREAISAARAAHKRADEELVTVQAALRRTEGDLAASREETRRLREETERALKRVEQDSEKRLARENIEALNAASEARRKSEEELAVVRRAANSARAEAETALARADDLTARVTTAERRAATAENELEQMRRERDTANIALREKSDTSEAELAHLRSQVAASKAELASVANLMDNVRVLEQRNAQLDRDLSRESQLRKKLHNTIEDMKGKIRVICRVRPLSSKEIGEGDHAPAVVKDGQASVSVIPPKGDKKRFTFDHVFEGTTAANSQSKLFEDVRHLVTSAVDGKTFTIGTSANIGDSFVEGGTVTEYAGIAPRTAAAVFEILDERSSQCETEVRLSMFEVYCDKIIDLLNNDKQQPQLKITLAEHSQTGHVAVEGSQSIICTSVGALVRAMARGIANRTTHATKMNMESSRSHLIMTLEVRTTNRRTAAVISGKVTLVDLAGSERVEKSGATGDRLKEATAINKSLSALGDVISSLTGGSAAHVPYRNHPLTMLMSDSIGGSAKTIMIVCSSPAIANASETISSLNFATRCKDVTSISDPRAAAAELSELRMEVARLRRQTPKVQGSQAVAPRAPAVLALRAPAGPRV